MLLLWNQVAVWELHLLTYTWGMVVLKISSIQLHVWPQTSGLNFCPFSITRFSRQFVPDRANCSLSVKERFHVYQLLLHQWKPQHSLLTAPFNISTNTVKCILAQSLLMKYVTVTSSSGTYWIKVFNNGLETPHIWISKDRREAERKHTVRQRKEKHQL